MRRASNPIDELRRAIDRLPIATREAMLEGIRAHPIVVGAYTDNRGGICPMLAAHRHGGRTTLLAFARSWDAFARARGVRRATRRELAVLEAQLTASLFAAEPDVDLGAAIADHEALKRRRDDERTYPEIRARRIRRATPSARSPGSIAPSRSSSDPARRSGRPVAAGRAARTAW